MPRGRQTTTGRSIGDTAGGRGALPSSIRTMGDYYRSGRASALNPGGSVTGADGTRYKRQGRGGTSAKS